MNYRRHGRLAEETEMLKVVFDNTQEMRLYLLQKED
jgi:hypothetical protein